MPCPPHSKSPVDVTTSQIVVRRRLQRLGIKISEIANDQRFAVRSWVASLTEEQVEYAAETYRRVDAAYERRVVTIESIVLDELAERDEEAGEDACPDCDSVSCRRCGRCACGCNCG